ncbi:MAG: mechanosensitive ion channel family protein [Tannerellaceae bacterium]|jgi:small-conductance mechanosensitive channel|nr:mechanosensitive ion channel family protein [Tannerellaceae bacterium]
MRKLFLRYLMAFTPALFTLSMAHAQSEPDSLTVTPPAVPVIVEGDTLFHIYSGQGGLPPSRRAENIREAILEAGKAMNFRSDTLHIEEGTYLTDIMYGEKVIFGITDLDAQQMGISRGELAQQYCAPIAKKIEALKKTYGILQTAKRTGLSILVVAVQILLIKLTTYLFRKLRRKIIRLKQTKLKPIVVRDYEFLNTRRQSLVLLFFSKMLKWVVILLQLMFSVPMLFSIFPQTRSIAITLFSYVLDPVKMIFWSVVSYIPNLFIIAIIYLCVRYINKGIRYIFQEIESGKLKVGGFYPDWAQPTFNIIRFLLYAFMIAMIYRYLPGSDSGVFQGISVFVGLIISLGSSTVIGNIIAGFVITYMRPFKVGDRIKLNETEGNVIEKTPLVTRLRTPKNEIVTIPNSFVMASHTTNYSASAREYGLIIHIDVGVGYDTPRPVALRLLIQAARHSPGVLASPEPFVLETALQDSYAVYQINAYVKEVNQLSKIYSDLNQRIHDIFQEAGIELLLPHYYAQRDGNPLAMPAEYLSKVQKR